MPGKPVCVRVLSPGGDAFGHWHRQTERRESAGSGRKHLAVEFASFLRITAKIQKTRRIE
jgi:oxalate decarboxylase/phosphoglucose isomerase-like protein (cupin superfamily)